MTTNSLRREQQTDGRGLTILNRATLALVAEQVSIRGFVDFTGRRYVIVAGGKLGQQVKRTEPLPAGTDAVTRFGIEKQPVRVLLVPRTVNVP